MPAPGESIQTMAFSPDDRTIALGCEDGTIRLWDVVAGEVRQCFSSDQGSISALAFSANGDQLASTGANKTGLIWDVRLPRRQTDRTWQVSRPDREALSARSGRRRCGPQFQSSAPLANAPQSALELLRERLRPVRSPEPKHIQRLIADLNSDNYGVREQAAIQLEKLGDGSETYLRQSLRQRPTLELRRRVERLLGLFAADSPDSLRLRRALEVLEWLNTQESRRLLEQLAHGAPGARLTREAKASLERKVTP